MGLSRPKINYLSHLIVKALQKAGTVTFLKPENDVRLQIVKTLTDELKIEEVIDAEVRRTLASYSRKSLRATASGMSCIRNSMSKR